MFNVTLKENNKNLYIQKNRHEKLYFESSPGVYKKNQILELITAKKKNPPLKVTGVGSVFSREDDARGDIQYVYVEFVKE